MKSSVVLLLMFFLIPGMLPAAEQETFADLVFQQEADQIFAEAELAQNQGDYSEAADLYEDLADDFPGASQAPEALFRLGTCLEKDDDFYDAFLAYQRILDEYPGKGSLNEILQRQFVIGEAFLGGRQRMLLFFRIRSGISTAEEIFESIVKTAPFSKIAPAAQFNLARTLQTDGRYLEAEVEYDHLLNTYAGSKEVPEALFQKIMCVYQVSLGPDYEQEDTIRALKLLEFYRERYPQSTHQEKVNQMISELQSRLAKRDYDIARYYQRKGDALGAITYYQAVADKYPGNPWEKEALARIEELSPEAQMQIQFREELEQWEEEKPR